MRRLSNYPAYHLFWKTKREVGKYHTKHKKAFLLRTQALDSKEGLLQCWFRVDYLPGAVNESIKYTSCRKALADARVFTAKSEVDFIQSYWRGEL